MDHSNEQIEICVNDQTQLIPAGTNIRLLLELLEIRSPAVAVELNCQLTPRDAFEVTELQAGDQLEIVTLVGGG